MSAGELRRVQVRARVRSGELRVVDASGLLGVSYRQAKRLWKRYREEGPAGLKHRSAGQPWHRAYAAKFRRKVLQLVREKYGGAVGERFGPTLAAEHLESEDGAPYRDAAAQDASGGLMEPPREVAQAPATPPAQGAFGELVKMDGSFHRWLEERGP